jgi:Uma2 family endonuclease
MATSTLVTIEQYLQTHYRPDVEFIDGELREKPVVQWVHSQLQSLISAWFVQHDEIWQVLVGVEARTRVAKSRIRLPDVVVVPAGSYPQTLVEPPLIVIEILSPDDSYSETQTRARDYQSMGIENIWLIDPETRTARVCRGENWTETARFTVEASPIYLDVTALFARLDKYQPAGHQK